MDWDHVLPGQNLVRADVVMASRCGAIMQVEKLSALAKRTVGVQIFANAPSIPALLDVLFSGCGEPPSRPDGPAGPGRPRADSPDAKESIYLKIAQKAFEAGYDPNVRVFPERFRRTFATAEEAVAWVAGLNSDRAADNMERLALNVEPFLFATDSGGVEFCIATKAAIIWWDVD